MKFGSYELEKVYAETFLLSAVGEQRYGLAASQLDNTDRADFRTPSWFDLDGQLTLSLASLVKRGEPRIRVQATNLLDSGKIWPSGYSYLYFVRDAEGRDAFAGTSYYSPLATRSVYVTLDVRF